MDYSCKADTNEIITCSKNGNLIVDARTGRFKGKIKKHHADFFGTRVLCGDLGIVNAGIRPSENKACTAVGLPQDLISQARRYPSGRSATMLAEFGYAFEDTITVLEGSLSNNYISLENWTTLYELATEIGATRAQAISRAAFEGTVFSKIGRIAGKNITIDEYHNFLSVRVLTIESNTKYKSAIRHNQRLLAEAFGAETYIDPQLRKYHSSMAPIGSGAILMCLFGMNKCKLLEYLETPERFVPSLRERTSPRWFISSDDLSKVHMLESAVTKSLEKLTEVELDIEGLVKRVHSDLCLINDDFMPRHPQKGEQACTMKDVGQFRHLMKARNADLP
jgi:hypothetical protein